MAFLLMPGLLRASPSFLSREAEDSDGFGFGTRSFLSSTRPTKNPSLSMATRFGAAAISRAGGRRLADGLDFFLVMFRSLVLGASLRARAGVRILANAGRCGEF